MLLAALFAVPAALDGAQAVGPPTAITTRAPAPSGRASTIPAPASASSRPAMQKADTVSYQNIKLHTTNTTIHLAIFQIVLWAALDRIIHDG
jgi:hypothetical protein